MSVSAVSPLNPRMLQRFTFKGCVWSYMPWFLFSLSFNSQRSPRRTWPMLSWSWPSPPGLQRAPQAAPSMRRSSSRRTSCRSQVRVPRCPVIYETSAPMGVCSFLPSAGRGPFPVAFLVPSQQSEAALSKDSGCGPEPRPADSAWANLEHCLLKSSL